MKLGYIYSITSKSTGMVYIGSTVEIRVETRWSEHRLLLKSKTHPNWKLKYLIYYQGMDDLVFKMELKGYFPTYQNLLNIEGIWIRSICEEFCLNIDRWPEKGGCMYDRKHKPETLIKMSESHRKYLLENPMTEEHRNKNRIANSGKNNPMYGSDCTKHNKEALLHSPNKEKHYFEINTLRFCKEFELPQRNIVSLITGNLNKYKGWTGERAPKWLVDKVLPLMEPGQYWVQIDEQGNIIDG